MKSDLHIDAVTDGEHAHTDKVVLHNADGVDVSNLPTIVNVMRIAGVREVTEWYTPGDRTTKHTSGPKIGSMEYELCFMDMTRDTWVPSEWLGDLQAPQVRD